MPDEAAASVEKNSFSDFMQRFNLLMKEAESYGVDCLVVLSVDDPLHAISVDGGTTSEFGYHGGRMNAIGLAEWAKTKLLDISEEE
jgi:hypothetical protein